MLSLVRLAFVPQIPSEAHAAMLGSNHTRAVENHDYSANLQSLKEKRIKEKPASEGVEGSKLFQLSSVSPNLTPGSSMLARGRSQGPKAVPQIPLQPKAAPQISFQPIVSSPCFLLESHSPVTVRTLSGRFGPSHSALTTLWFTEDSHNSPSPDLSSVILEWQKGDRSAIAVEGNRLETSDFLEDTPSLPC